MLIRGGDDDGYWSAGQSNPHGLPEWPEGRTLAPRRMRGYEHFDRTERDPPIAWRVRVDGFAPFAVQARTYEEASAAACEELERRGALGEGTHYVGIDVRPAD